MQIGVNVVLQIVSIQMVYNLNWLYIEISNFSPTLDCIENEKFCVPSIGTCLRNDYCNKYIQTTTMFINTKEESKVKETKIIFFIDFL